MAKTSLALVERVKVALMGDMAHTDRSLVQAEVDASFERQRPERGAVGRIYGSFDVPKPARAGRIPNPLAPVAAIWTKLRSIGEYDAARTR